MNYVAFPENKHQKNFLLLCTIGKWYISIDCVFATYPDVDLLRDQVGLTFCTFPTFLFPFIADTLLIK